MRCRDHKRDLQPWTSWCRIVNGVVWPWGTDRKANLRGNRDRKTGILLQALGSTVLEKPKRNGLR